MNICILKQTPIPKWVKSSWQKVRCLSFCFTIFHWCNVLCVVYTTKCSFYLEMHQKAFGGLLWLTPHQENSRTKLEAWIGRKKWMSESDGGQTCPHGPERAGPKNQRAGLNWYRPEYLKILNSECILRSFRPGSIQPVWLSRFVGSAQPGPRTARPVRTSAYHVYSAPAYYGHPRATVFAYVKQLSGMG